jgi:hypothetical protein
LTCPQIAGFQLSTEANSTVIVETRYELTFDWMDEQIARVGDALDLVKERYHELKASQDSVAHDRS